MSALPFLKMHGLGNDFVVVDLRGDPRRRAPVLDGARARRIADRRTGVGCDQLLVIEAARSAEADAFLRIVNADGSEAAACGNGTRCVAALLMKERGRDHVVIETAAGLLEAAAAEGGLVSVDMGPACLDWREIPLARPMDTLHLDLALGPLADPVAVNIGNPHAVFFVPEADGIDIASLGPELERHPLFPDRANIEVASLAGPGRIRMRVWERGAGITRACGTGACATLVAAARRALTGRKADILLDGGSLAVEWQPDGHVRMTGPVALSFAGELPAEAP